MAAPSSFVSEQRLWDSLQAMARFGATAAGGVNRQALSQEDSAAQTELVRWGQSIGMLASRDAAGNLFLRLPGSDASAAPVLSGSHLDSQPTGGKFDGVYGVLAAFEAARAIRATGVAPRRSIDVVAWMNEEGSRFAPGMMGSAVFAGDRPLDTILAAQDAQGVRVGEALALQQERLAHVPLRALGGAVHAFVEAHIEQGPVLEREGFPVGIVSGIQGKHTFRVEVIGEAAHAGTSQRSERKDALLAATGMVQALAAAFHDFDDITKFTIGRFEVLPNAPSVVAAKVVFSIDLRHPDTARLRAMSAQVEHLCAAARGPCEVQVQRLSAADSLEFPEALRQRARAVADRLATPWRDLPSAAGHDARYLHAVTPTAMLFVPCHLGITHNEAESATPSDLAAGTRVLADLLLELAND
ncbi:M20 family metallo-hydrolase [Pseudorhodoferax sp. Leaf265]|uniref:M20 family metallo-hydrolase n=1 Tax=Pseudorhodoferax sp. Leaf265 TaxID=1736315 RepID=UPI0006FF2E83|nr:M20 family metallo-hydrolase [Pseudorhodoferax sp. Leaf265]KQP12911.1 Zn-dependent hydrolase [Pseudorhodoferax sp. Leaf265]PZP91569.1 MAG: Zn-dependent hydrolase [Variovorax paradoxus]PZQ01329.1 MAG: Zn-dependent hydrolase [Variovorax paradoxus]